MISEKILKFKNRELKGKDVFTIKEISKKEAYSFISEYHYLGEAKFFSKYSYGLFIDDYLVGVATYSNPQGINSLKSWFGFDNKNQTIMELHRLCMLPDLNGSNATSYLLGNSIKELKKVGIQAVITLADKSRHVGSIYQVCNFKYYGLTDKKTDFYSADGKVNPRGSTKDVKGVWLPRTRKHRYCYIIDKELEILLKEETRPDVDSTDIYECCGGKNIVYDNRYNETYTCPKCSDNIRLLK